ncbi:DUF4910 domain-containing protein [Pelagibacteraceae bacterium]|nr:DUF4910 domain-containing protein [Pelagibacteraceae bacterium]
MINKSELQKIIHELWPLNRSLTGKDVRKTHKILSKITPMKKKEYRSGTKVFDWKIPPEWNVKDAYIITPDRKKILSFKNNNLHLLNYSIPFNGTVSLDVLKKNLYSDPLRPNTIPYVTSYYKKKWGFCIKHSEIKKLKKGRYKVYISAEHNSKGSLTISEKKIPGKNKKEILFQSYTCHPSMLTNELLGPVALLYLAKYVEQLKDRKYSYRFILLPETIGTITYLNKNITKIRKNFLAGYVLTCLGLKKFFYFKRSKERGSVSNKLAENFFNLSNKNILNYNPGGSDERQYNMSGIGLPVGCLMTALPGKFKEYHSSSDNLNLLNENILIANIRQLIKFVDYLEKQTFYEFKKNKCEPFLSKYINFYGTKGNSNANPKLKTMALKWIVHFCDGSHTLKEISKLSKIKIAVIKKIIKVLKQKKIIS